MTTTAAYALSVVLGLISLGLFLAAVWHLLVRREDDVPARERYEDSGAVTRTIEQPLDSPHVGDRVESPRPEAERVEEAVIRALERARARTDADAAMLIVRDGGAPAITSVGLSDEEVDEVSRTGPLDHRGASAVELSYSLDADGEASGRIRSGLCVPVLDSRSMLTVLTRSPRRRFSDADVDALREAAEVVRRALRPDFPDLRVEREPEMLADLLDRGSFYAACSREIARARAAGTALSLLVVHVDHPAQRESHVPRVAQERLSDELAQRLRRLADSQAVVCRLDERRLGVLVVDGDRRAADGLFEHLLGSLAREPLPDNAGVSLSGGAAELGGVDGPSMLLERAERARRPETRVPNTAGISSHSAGRYGRLDSARRAAVNEPPSASGTADSS